MIETRLVSCEAPHASDIRRIRHEVFTIGQGIDPEADFDGQDPEAVHALVILDGKAVGTGRLLPDGHLGRCAVLEPHRGRGLGAEVVRALVDEARARGLQRVFLGAQEPAAGFYEKLGFSVYGEPFVEVGIPHVHMERFI